LPITTPALITSAVCTGPMITSAADDTASPADWKPPRGSGTISHSVTTARSRKTARREVGGGGVTSSNGSRSPHPAIATPQA